MLTITKDEIGGTRLFLYRLSTTSNDTVDVQKQNKTVRIRVLSSAMLTTNK